MTFDEIEADDRVKANAKPNPRRLGHRRPWWQWNVLTLFAALFVLVWMRELARLPQFATWVICVAILAVWALGPILSLELPPPRAARPYEPFPLGPPRSEARREPPSASLPRNLAIALAIMMFVGVFALGGLVVCVLALLGAMLYAAAVRDR
jgi:hypothetical protein